MDKKKKKADKYKVILYSLSFIIPFFAVLIGLLAGSYAPFGGKNVLSISNSQTLAYYYELWDRVHEGQSLTYSNTSGLGYDFSAVISYYLSDPTNLIILLFPRTALLSVLNLMFSVKVGLAGLFMAIYLEYKNKFSASSTKAINNNLSSEEISKKDFVLGIKGTPKTSTGRFIKKFNWLILALSIAYSLSTGVISVGMNVTYIASIAILPLIIMGVDKILAGEKPAMFVLTLSISFYCNIHITIISLVFTLAYFITRDYRDTLCFLNSLVKLFVSIIISLLCSSMIIMNSIQSTFFKNDICFDFPTFSIYSPIDSLKQLMSHYPLAILTMYGNNIDIAIGTLLILTLFLYVLSNKINIITRIKNIILVIMLLLGPCTTTLRFIFNGFSVSANNSIHYGYIICFFFIIIAYDVLKAVDSLKPVHVILSSCLSFSFIIICMLFSTQYDSMSIFFVSIEFLFGYFIISLIISSKSMTKSLYGLLISLLLIIEIVPISIQNITNIGNSVYSQRIDNISSIQYYEASRFIHSKDPNAKILFYNPSSTMSEPVSDSFLGYDYIISPYDKDEINSSLSYVTTFALDHSVTSLNIYSNPYALHNVLLYKDIVSYYYDRSTPFTSMNKLANYLNYDKPIYNDVDISINPSVALDRSSTNFNITCETQGEIYFKAYSINYISNNKGDEKSFSQTTPYDSSNADPYYFWGVSFDKDNYVEMCENALEIKPANGNYVSEKNGYITYDYSNINSLKFYVNGNRVKPVSLINNNVLIPIESGNNEIIVKYNASRIILSVLISILTALSFIYYERKNKNDNINNKVASLSRLVDKYYVYIMSIAIFTGLFILVLMIASCVPFGSNSAINGDGFLQGFPSWSNDILAAKKGTFLSTVSYNLGTFQDLQNDRIITALLYPWNYIVFKFLPSSMYLAYYTWSIYLLYVLSIVTIIYYLTHRRFNKIKRNNKKLIVLALMYTTSSFAILFFSYQAGFKYLPFLPILALGTEQIVYKNKCALYIIALSFLMIYDPYHAFLMCEFLVVLFLLSKYNNAKHFIVSGIQFALSSIIAALLSAIKLVPFYIATRGNAYLSSDGETPSIFKFFTSIVELLYRYHNGNIITVVSTDNSQSALYCGMIALFIIPIYLTMNRTDMIQKCKKAFAIIVLLIATNNELLNFVFHGFHYQSNVPNRFALFIIFLLIGTIADVVYSEKNINKKTVSIIITIISILFIAVYLTKPLTMPIILSIVILVSYIYSSMKTLLTKRANMFSYLFIVLLLDLVINFVIVMPSSIGTDNKRLVLANDINTLTENIDDIDNIDVVTEYLSQNSDYSNIGLQTRINTASFFANTFNANTMYFIGYGNITTGMNIVKYNNGNPLADMLLHLKYHIVDSYDPGSISIYNKVTEYKNLELYENPYYLPIGIFISEADVNNYTNNVQKTVPTPIEYQNNYSRGIANVDIFTRLECEKNDGKNDSPTYYTYEKPYENVESNTSVEKYYPTTIHIDKNITGHIYTAINRELYYLGEVDDSTHTLTMDYPAEVFEADQFTPSIAVLNEDNLQILHDKLSAIPMTNTIFNKNIITGNIDCKTTGKLYISLPYYSGWEAYVDGNKSTISHFWGGIGIDVPAGTHIIKLVYHSPGARLGIIISVITFIVIICYVSIKHTIMREFHYNINN